MSDLFLVIKTDHTVPSSQNTVGKNKTTRDSFFAFSLGLFRQLCVWQTSQLFFFGGFLWKQFFCLSWFFVKSYTLFFSCFFQHSLSCSSSSPTSKVLLVPTQVLGWSGSCGSTPVPVLHYFGQLHLHFNHLLHEENQLLLHVTLIYL